MQQATEKLTVVSKRQHGDITIATWSDGSESMSVPLDKVEVVIPFGEACNHTEAHSRS
jgi:hypothetical protein